MAKANAVQVWTLVMVAIMFATFLIYFFYALGTSALNRFLTP